MAAPVSKDPVVHALQRYALAVGKLKDARLNERLARSSGDTEALDDAVYERLKCEKEARDAARGEAQARASRAAARARKPS